MKLTDKSGTVTKVLGPLTPENTRMLLMSVVDRDRLWTLSKDGKVAVHLNIRQSDKPIADEWMRIPHFYYNFYVYKYATCISAAASIVKRMEERGDEYIGKYIDFLKCGGSRSPLDSLKVAGIDMTSPAVVEDAISVFADTLHQFRELADKLGLLKK